MIRIVLKSLRTALRALEIVFALVTFFLIASVLEIALGKRLASAPKGWLLLLVSRLTLWAYGVKVTTVGEPLRDPRSVLVSNHISFLDILVISSRLPVRYITSMEMREQWVGTLTELAGCLYTERRKKDPVSTHKEIERVALELRKTSAPIVLFAEGTSTVGETVLPFKGRFFESVVIAKVPVQTVCLQYIDEHGNKLIGQDADRIAFYGDMSLGAHLKNLLLQDRTHCRLDWIEVLWPSPHLARSELKNLAHATVLARYKNESST